jgi:hypothetical protein
MARRIIAIELGFRSHGRPLCVRNVLLADPLVSPVRKITFPRI